MAPNWNNIVQNQYWFSETFWRNLRLFLYECCSMWKLFSIFVLSRKRQTYRKCFRTVLIWKCGNFQRIKDNERHSFLVSIWQGVFLCAYIPYLASVGYCIFVYLIRVRHNLQIDKRNRLHTFFFVNRLNWRLSARNLIVWWKTAGSVKTAEIPCRTDWPYVRNTDSDWLKADSMNCRG